MLTDGIIRSNVLSKSIYIPFYDCSVYNTCDYLEGEWCLSYYPAGGGFTKPRADTSFERKALLRTCSANVPGAGCVSKGAQRNTKGGPKEHRRNPKGELDVKC